MAAIGAGSVVWPFIDQMNPAADTLALSTTEVDIASVQEGQAITVMWRGKPVFIRHRTAEEIKAATEVDVTTLRHKEADDKRVQKPEWLILVGICTHLGLRAVGTKDRRKSGRVSAGGSVPVTGRPMTHRAASVRGPLPKNLEVPTYTFVTDTLVRIG
jgi:ubiquinol-cytochrome c reductase iron-sulfur subunit